MITGRLLALFKFVSRALKFSYFAKKTTDAVLKEDQAMRKYRNPRQNNIVPHNLNLITVQGSAPHRPTSQIFELYLWPNDPERTTTDTGHPNTRFSPERASYSVVAMFCRSRSSLTTVMEAL